MVNQRLLKIEIEKALDESERVWKKVEPEIINESLEKAFKTFSAQEKVPTQIPGFPFISEGKPEVADFIALVLDIRNSTEHLIQAISKKTAKASQLERVLYEITAINTAGAIYVDHYNGGITEFLGDGFLALYKVEDRNDPKEVYSAHNTAKNFINDGLSLVNHILDTRYSLPPLEVGIGMAFSQAIVTIVGHGTNIHPKAIGECVYRASKLSNGTNQILIDKRLKQLWPKTEGGQLRFNLFTNRKIDFEAFEIKRKN